MTVHSLRAALASAILSVLVVSLVPSAHAAAQSGGDAGTERTTQIGPSGLPVPRFVSLKSDRINVRAGPGQDHAISWVFTKAGLPVEIIAEYDNWRRIRDSEGAEGWIFHSLLSGRRTAIIAPWSKIKTIALRRDRDENGQPAARVEPNVLVDVNECDGTWCRVSVKNVSGWITQDTLWGVYPDETVN